MDDSYTSRRKRTSRARERYEARQQRRRMPTMARPRQAINPGSGALGSLPTPDLSQFRSRLALLAGDAAWHARNTPIIPISMIGVVLVAVAIFALSYTSSGRIFPNVWALGIHLGDLTTEEAHLRLLKAWNEEITIRLVDESRSWDVRPDQLGLRLNAAPMVEAARGVGMSGVLGGWDIAPELSIEYITAQNFLLDRATEVEVPAYNAGYRLVDGEVVGVPGTMGRMMDVGMTMGYLNDSLVDVVRRRRLDLIMQPIEPEVVDPTPYLDQVRSFVRADFRLYGYDPVRNESVSWGTSPDTLISWLEAGTNSLTLRPTTFIPFLEAQNNSLNAEGSLRYLDTNETMEAMRGAIAELNTSVLLRVRYRPTQYTVVSGDRGYSIARKTGIPFNLLEQANAGRNLNVLSVGDVLNIPSRDAVLPITPASNKRIIVDLRTQSLKAYEDGREVFSWLISSGQSQAPTYPGVFQILSHNEVASGSSFDLCNAQGCGQWQMYWFMGIYEVIPGLMNGFHGAVLLPNGAYLGGGNVGAPYTYGCIMSLNSNAEALYRWAEMGTVVEIISSDHPPQSELARQAFFAADVNTDGAPA